MSLIACPECDRTISDLAPHCPGCGYPVREYVQRLADQRKERQVRLTERRRLMRKWRNLAIVAGIIIVLVFAFIVLPLLTK